MNNLDASSQEFRLPSTPLIFVGGKGGVGKTVISQAMAAHWADLGKRTLWMSIEDPMLPLGERRPLYQNLWHLNADSSAAFEEYIGMKLRVPFVAKLFTKNPLMQYLAKAAPGIHELILLGKIWNERKEFDHVVVDLPSTGHGLAMFRSAMNFSKLFKGGPIHKDAVAMLETFSSPKETSHVIISIPEEMPLTESQELADHLKSFFPENHPFFILNRVFPELLNEPEYVALNQYTSPDEWPDPTLKNLRDYAIHRSWLEHCRIQDWKESLHLKSFGMLPNCNSPIVDSLTDILKEKRWFR